MTKQEIANHVFARNPEVKQLHVTSDGQAFFEKHKAQSHAQRLKDHNIEDFTKESKLEAAGKAAKAAGAQKAKEEAEAAEKAAADQKAKEEAEAAEKATEPKKPASKKGKSNQKSE